MSALDRVPTKYQSLPSIRGMASTVDRLRGQNRELRQKAEEGEGATRKTVGIQGGAGLAGVLTAYTPATYTGPAPSLVGALLAFGAGMASGSADLVNIANGLLAPYTAAAVANRLAGGTTGRRLADEPEAA